MIEEGFPDFDLSAWYGVIAPQGTPAEIVSRLSAHIAKVLQMPDVKELLARQGLEAQSSTPEELMKELKEDIARYRKLLNDAGVQPL